MKRKSSAAHFITGTGTDIGKTWLTCALLRHWRAQGLAPCAYKPVLSGFDPQQTSSSDAGRILEALGRRLTVPDVQAVSPWRFAAPLSPDMAAAAAGETIDFGALTAFTRRVADECPSAVLVEGVGGVMAPLDGRHTVRDWIDAAGLPAVLVTGSYLGAMSHALTALAALKGSGVGVTAVAINETPDSPVPLQATADSLAPHCGDVPVIILPRSDPDPAVRNLAQLLL